MTDTQKLELRQILRYFHRGLFHHGDCIGADAEAHDIAREFSYGVEIHPPLESRKRAWCSSMLVHDPKPYLERNHDIVDACHLLIACPAGPEVMRSGTWATIRYARRTGVPVVIIERGE